MTKPLILSPAGSYEALLCAVNAGADEVYFGLPEFNARYNAKNFTDEELKKALDMCRILGVGTNITVNTLITDKEMPRALDMVYNAASLGADAFIVQDLGFASEIKRQMPGVVLHASTQCACHSVGGALALSEMGFSRVVLAREMPMEEIKKVTSLGIETEIFVHGALCVCQSGMCLMSSVIGSRSGNRGLCAQPCRLPYTAEGLANKYPLSLKDLSLATRIEDILSLGVKSLKIEGRMKSPEYVYETTKIWREVLDGGKSATRAQMSSLENIFSRNGFTDKYFTGKYKENNTDMYGVRRESDKKNTRSVEKKLDFSKSQRKTNVEIFCEIESGKNVTMSLSCHNKTVTARSEEKAQKANARPLTENDVVGALSKLGNTYFSVSDKDVHVNIKDEAFLNKSALNELRRECVRLMENELCNKIDVLRNVTDTERKRRAPCKSSECLAVIKNVEMIENVTGAKYISIPLLALENLKSIEELNKKQQQTCGDNLLYGVTLPRVIYSLEEEKCLSLLQKAKKMGFSFALVSNIGHVRLAKESALSMFSSIGMNVFNSKTFAVLENMGFSLVTVSPELNEAQIRDIEKAPNTKLCAFVKGKLPIMVLESCIVKANGKCKNANAGEKCTTLCDRIGKKFDVYGERRLCKDGRPCRNIIYNSVETDLLSNAEKLAKINADVKMIML